MSVLNKLLRAFITVLGTMAIPGILLLIQALYDYIGQGDLFAGLPAWAPIAAYLVSGALSAAIFYALSKSLALPIERGIVHLEQRLREQPSMALLAGGIGLIMGLIVAALFSVVIGLIPIAWVSVPLTIIFYIIFGYLGTSIGMSRRDDIAAYFSKLFFHDYEHEKAQAREAVEAPKILDSSVLIDGRIYDIIETGVFDGPVVVPAFVLAELQGVAASDDPVKRSRGRRGLDLVTKMQKELPQRVTVATEDYPDALNVHAKLIRLARDTHGKLITEDYGLNKLAKAQNIEIFNINELANAMKPALTAGEELCVQIAKTGRDPGQGVGYLEDGTMIVVNGAAKYVHSEVVAVVTSVLQTPAGRMIFAKIPRSDAEVSEQEG